MESRSSWLFTLPISIGARIPGAYLQSTNFQHLKQQQMAQRCSESHLGVMMLIDNMAGRDIALATVV